MFNKEFFPTPPDVIDRMLSHLEVKDIGGRRYLKHRTILEPSAGKGDICERLVNGYGVDRKRVYTIEIESDLQAILREKGYRIVDTDFLQFHEPLAIDLIIMNPPFASGVDHLLHAWDVLDGQGGDIVCLLNAETIRNPHTAKRKLLLDIIEKHGDYEMIGPAFKTAERTTDVDVAIVRLHRDADKQFEFDTDGLDFEATLNDEAYAANPLAHANIIQSLVAQYDGAIAAATEAQRALARQRFYMQSIVEKQPGTQKHTGINDAIANIKTAFWKYIFDKTNLGKRATSKFRNNFFQFVEQTSTLAFTERNIMSVLEMFFLNQDTIIQQCVVDVFDTATRYHEKNTEHTEGWKTNKSWKIAPKIIIPHGVEYRQYMPGRGWWSMNYHRDDFFSDLDRAACFVDGTNIEDITTIEAAMRQRFHDMSDDTTDYQKRFESTYFEIKIHKKGTVHLWWKRDDLLAKFNQIASEGKNWVGAGY